MKIASISNSRPPGRWLGGTEYIDRKQSCLPKEKLRILAPLTWISSKSDGAIKFRALFPFLRGNFGAICFVAGHEIEFTKIIPPRIEFKIKKVKRYFLVSRCRQWTLEDCGAHMMHSGLAVTDVRPRPQSLLA